jgi:peptidoglycan/xylan/chitin deacetylase (PgdA/CDA1 family)
MAGTLVISLDFELAWGIPDAERERLLPSLYGARAAVPALLERFAAHRVHATWATVGALFARNRDELLAVLPEPSASGLERGRDPARHRDRIGHTEADAPLYFAPSLIERILRTPGQELGSHTMSHAPALEGSDRALRLRADLDAAQRLAEQTTGARLQSLVFPYNQYDDEALRVAAQAGFRAFRGNVPHSAHHPAAASANRWSHRAIRLADQFVPLLTTNTLLYPAPSSAPLVNVRASRFLRPVGASKFAAKQALHRTCALLTAAAETDQVVHLWAHPHNFGHGMDRQLRWLDEVLTHVDALRRSHGLTSATMSEMADKALAS